MRLYCVIRRRLANRLVLADLQSSSPHQDDCIVSAVSGAGAGNLGGPDINLQRDAEEAAAAATV